MTQNSESVTYFAEANFRNKQKRFGIKRKDRTKHVYVIGKTGMGKTTLLENMALQDIINGEGLAFIDPHGDTAEKLLNFVPESRIDEVLYLSPSDTENPVGFNIMEDVDPSQRHLVANGMMGVFKKIWPDVWSSRMEYILNNCILALLEYPDSTMLGINRMLSDKDFRKAVVSNVSDTVVKAFWTDEFAKYSERFMVEAGAAIQNKIGQFISNPLIRNIIGQPKSTFNIREIMDEKKIFIINLSKGRIGEENSRLIGALLITKLYLSAMSRVDIPEDERNDFYLYVDEFQNFATESFKDILSEARKYKLSLILAHQYVAQMDETVRDAVFGNVGTQIAFRVGAYDAELLEKEFAPEFYIQDIVNLGFASIYLKLMIDGVASRPFSATTLPPIQLKEDSHIQRIIDSSRQKYARSKSSIEDDIKEWHQPVDKPEKVGAPGREQAFGSGGGADTCHREVDLHKADCAVCGKEITVPFKPDGKRPIYCPTHRKQAQAAGTPQSTSPRPQFVLSPQALPSQTVSPKELAPQAQREVVSLGSQIETPQSTAPKQLTVPPSHVVPPKESAQQKKVVPAREAPLTRQPQSTPQRRQTPQRQFIQNRSISQRRERTISLKDLSKGKKADIRSDELRKALNEALRDDDETKKEAVESRRYVGGEGKSSASASKTEAKPKPAHQARQSSALSNNGKVGVIKPGEKINFDR